MEKSNTRYKGKNKKTPTKQKTKTAKKPKSDGNGPSCSMFLAEISRKLASKKKKEEEFEEHKSIVQTIIDSITNALPVKFSRKSPPKVTSPMKIETLQTFAPELLPKSLINIPPPLTIRNDDENGDVQMSELEIATHKPSAFKMPKMPLVNSDVFKIAVQERTMLKEPMQDEAINTSSDNDVASALAKHVNTLKKISLIAEEFNQKTAKNLKEIVDSVQNDLVKKLEEIQSEQQTISEVSLPSKSKNLKNDPSTTEQ